MTGQPEVAGDALDRLTRAEMKRSDTDYGRAFDTVCADPRNAEIVRAYEVSADTLIGVRSDFITVEEAGDKLDELASSQLRQYGGDYQKSFDAVSAEHQHLLAAYNGDHSLIDSSARSLSLVEERQALAVGRSIVRKLGAPSAGGGSFLMEAA